MAVTQIPTQQTSPVVIPFSKNGEALAELQQENERLAAGWGISMLTAAGYLTAPLIFPPTGTVVAAAGLMASAWTSWRSEKVIRLIQINKSLLETFGSKGVEIYPRIPVEGMNPLEVAWTRCELIADQDILTEVINVTQSSKKPNKRGEYSFVCWFKSELDKNDNSNN